MGLANGQHKNHQQVLDSFNGGFAAQGPGGKQGWVFYILAALHQFINKDYRKECRGGIFFRKNQSIGCLYVLSYNTDKWLFSSGFIIITHNHEKERGGNNHIALFCPLWCVGSPLKGMVFLNTIHIITHQNRKSWMGFKEYSVLRKLCRCYTESNTLLFRQCMTLKT